MLGLLGVLGCVCIKESLLPFLYTIVYMCTYINLTKWITIMTNSTTTTIVTNSTINLISGVECNNEEAKFIHNCLFNNIKKSGESMQDTNYIQHLKEVSNELKLIQMQYFVQPMLGDFPIGPLELIEKEELLEMIHRYNHGTQGYYDEWFTLTTVGGMELEIADYYKEAQAHADSMAEMDSDEVYQEVADDGGFTHMSERQYDIAGFEEDEYQERDDAEDISVYNEYMQDLQNQVNEDEYWEIIETRRDAQWVAQQQATGRIY